VSETIRGTFEGYTIKTGNKKNGDTWTLYTVIVDGKKYGYGFTAPKAGVGEVVEFRAEKNDKGYWDIDDGSFKTTGATAPVAAASAAHAAQTAGNTVPYSDPKQSSIETQSSISAAARIVAAQINAGAELDPAQAVAALVRSFLNILHPTPKAPPKPKPAAPPAEDDDTLPSY
jgi:hypothetical protein